MVEIVYSKARYFPDGMRTIAVNLGSIDSPTAIQVGDLTVNVDEIISMIEEAERQISEKKELSIQKKLVKDPKTRLEALKGQKLKLEEGIRLLSAEIMKAEEAIGDREGRV